MKQNNAVRKAFYNGDFPAATQISRLFTVEAKLEIELIGTINRLAPLLSTQAMRALVGQQTLDMQDVLEEGWVVLVNTGGGNHASDEAFA